MSLIPAFAGIYQEFANANKNKICIVILSIAKYPQIQSANLHL